jgi:type II secretory ATPase GspE/PulE/Tfp pilus assembly ATPase PilB-like protein
LKSPSESAIKKEAKAQGMVTMKQDGIIKALKGATTIEEVLRVAEEK